MSLDHQLPEEHIHVPTVELINCAYPNGTRVFHSYRCSEDANCSPTRGDLPRVVIDFLFEDGRITNRISRLLHRGQL